MPQEAQSFRSVLGWGMGRRGFAGGFADVVVTRDGFTMKGEEKGELQTPVARIKKMRVGYTESKDGKIFETYLWLDGDEKKVLLGPIVGDEDGYRAGIRLLASALGKSGRESAILTGTSTFDAVITPVLFGILLIAALGVSFFAIGNFEWWHPLAIAGVPATVFGVFLWQSIYRFWPRQATSLADLDKQLPP